MAIEHDYIKANLLNLKLNIREICERCGRDPDEINIVAVSKTFPPAAIRAALDCNQLDFGENRPQELVSKAMTIPDKTIQWHLVGTLQTNKVKLIVPYVFLIHSLDSYKLAMKINSEARKINKIINCLIQVNTSREQQKSGCEPEETIRLTKEISGLEYIRICGLMTIAKMMSNERDEAERKIVRSNFRILNELYNEMRGLNIPGTYLRYLSMGMSSDYDIAIEEGSNMLRIGSDIFGRREY